MDAFQILVIILSVFLALFLLLAIVVIVYILKLVKTLREISDKAASLVSNASDIAGTMKKAAAPSVVAKFMIDTIQKAVKKHSEKGGK